MQITPKLVSKYIKQAGFKSKAEFARKMGLNPASVNNWGVCAPLPSWFYQVLEWAKKAKKYDEMQDKSV